LEPRQEQIRLLGGSNAQRDLVFQMLIDAAMKSGQRDVVGAIIAHETTTRISRTASGQAIPAPQAGLPEHRNQREAT
jgi:hypothetical protein